MQLIDRATGEEPVFVYRSRAEQASFQKHQPSGDQIFEMRSKLNKTQSEMCQLAHVRFISTWGAYESGFTKMSPERWELLELQLGVHQQCEIKFRDNVSSIPSSALKGPSNDQARIDQYHLPSAKQFGIKQREDKRP